MRNTKNGSYFYLGVVSITSILWIFAKIVERDMLNSSLWNIYLVQIFGLLAVTFLTMNFVLATRVRFLENIFGGLDRLFKYHKLSGRIGFMLIWAHPFFNIVKDITNFTIIKIYFVPGSIIEYTFGMLGLYLFTFLIFLTVGVKLPYHIWKYTHKLMIVPFVFAGIHIYLSESDVKDFLPLRIWILGLVAIGILCWIYREFLYGSFGPVYSYVVEKVALKEPVTEIQIKPVGKRMNFKPGQFAFFSFRGSNEVTSESHPFSLSSNPSDEMLRVSSKDLGDYTSTLRKLTPGTKVQVIGPYGRFSQEYVRQTKNEIWLAGGIGITPFLSMLKNENSNPSSKNIGLIYSCKNESEAVYNSEIEGLVSSSKNVKYQTHFSDNDGFLTAGKIKELFSTLDFTDITVFICGPKGMMKSLSKQFKELGVNSENIVFEEFSLK